MQTAASAVIQAAPDRSRDLHPLQHLRGDLPRRLPSRTIDRNYVVDAGQVQPVHGLHLALPDRLDRQLAGHAARQGLHARPNNWAGTSCRELSAEALAEAGVSGETVAEVVADSPAADASDVAAAAPSAAHYGATRPPWSAAHAYTNLYGPKAAEQVRHRHGHGQCTRDRRRARLRHAPHRAGLWQPAISSAGRTVDRHHSARHGRQWPRRTMRASTRSPARATANAPATTTCR